MQLSGMTKSDLALARSLSARSMTPSRRLQPHRNATRLYSVMFDALLHVAFHLLCTSASARMHWLSSQCFTAAEIRPSGGAEYKPMIDSETWRALGCVPALHILRDARIALDADEFRAIELRRADH